MFSNLRKKIKNLFSYLREIKNNQKGALPLLAYVIITVIAGAAASWMMNDSWRQWMTDVGMGVLKGLASFAFWISKQYLDVSCFLMENVLSSDFLSQNIVKNSVVTTGWDICRNFANMFIVLGFVVIGIATILRLQEYQFQKTLPWLILVAILVNFSPLICGLIIDASHITMNYFLSFGGAGSNLIQPIRNMYTTKDPSTNLTFEEKLKSLTAQGSKTSAQDTNEMLRNYITLTLYNVFMMCAFFYMAIMLIARQAMLMFLVILSPLAFFCYVFPTTKKLWEMWWQNFISWTLAGVGLLFTVYLAVLMMYTSTTSNNTQQDPSSVLTSMTMIVPVIFLIAGIQLTKKTSAMGAGAIMGLATKGAYMLGGYALGATKWGAGKVGQGTKWAGGKALETKTGQSAKSSIGGLLEKTPFRKHGATAAATASQAAEAEKRLSNLSSDKLSNIALRKTTIGPDRSVAAKILAERGDFSKIPADKRNSVMARAKAFGIESKVFEKAMPGLVFANAANPSAQELQKYTDRVSGLDIKEKRNLPNTELTPAFLSAMSPKEFGKLKTTQQDYIRNTYGNGNNASAINAHVAILGRNNMQGGLDRLNENLRISSGTARKSSRNRKGAGRGGTQRQPPPPPPPPGYHTTPGGIITPNP